MKRLLLLLPLLAAFPAAAQPVRDITVTMGDMSFSPDHLTVKAGEKVRFVLRNTSAIDHDFTLGDAATQAAHRARMAEGHGGHGDHGGHDRNAVMVPAGGTAELVWTFDRAGELEFDCNVPGHYESGMRGQLTVTR